MESQTELPFRQRDEFDQELYLRPISANGRRFLQIMFQAANGTPDEGVDGHYLKRRSQYIMAGEQSVLAELMHCSERTVRRTVDELEALGILKRWRPIVEVEGKPTRLLSYVLCLLRLIDLPTVDVSTALGRTVVDLLDVDVFEDGPECSETPAEACAESQLSTPESPVSGGLSGALSGRLSGGLSAPHGLGPGLGDQNQINPLSSGHGHGQGVCKNDFSETVWRDLTDDDVRQLAKTPDLEKINELFRVGVYQFGWADDPVFKHHFVAMIRHCGTAKGINTPVGSLRGLMKKRDWTKLTNEAEDWARSVLSPARPRAPAPAIEPQKPEPLPESGDWIRSYQARQQAKAEVTP